MSEIEPKTTPISENTFHPLEVEWTYHKYHYAMVDGYSIQQPQHFVSLVYPGGAFEQRRTRLVNFSPKTALNLLDWLEQNQLAEDEV
jgi:hypothetical protein